jgi:hypothetical protein
MSSEEAFSLIVKFGLYFLVSVLSWVIGRWFLKKKMRSDGAKAIGGKLNEKWITKPNGMYYFGVYLVILIFVLCGISFLIVSFVNESVDYKMVVMLIAVLPILYFFLSTERWISISGTEICVVPVFGSKAVYDQNLLSSVKNVQAGLVTAGGVQFQFPGKVLKLSVGIHNVFPLLDAADPYCGDASVVLTELKQA